MRLEKIWEINDMVPEVMDMLRKYTYIKQNIINFAKILFLIDICSKIIILKAIIIIRLNTGKIVIIYQSTIKFRTKLIKINITKNNTMIKIIKIGIITSHMKVKIITTTSKLFNINDTLNNPNSINLIRT
jgi:hypothetical protein